MKPAHLVCFRIGAETFGVPISAVKEIVRVQAITKVPGTPEFMPGVVNLRGRILSVVDLGHRLGLAPSVVNGSSRILVTHPGWIDRGVPRGRRHRGSENSQQKHSNHLRPWRTRSRSTTSRPWQS